MHRDYLTVRECVLPLCTRVPTFTYVVVACVVHYILNTVLVTCSINIAEANVDTSVGLDVGVDILFYTVTDWTIGFLGFDSRRGLGILLFTASRTALGPTQPPIQWIPGTLSLGIKRPGREDDH
jgi:hypothetical protein